MICMGRRVRGMVWAGTFLLTAGCGDLHEFAALQTVADGLRKTLPAIAEDFFASCERRGTIAAQIRTANPANGTAAPSAGVSAAEDAVRLCLPSKAVAAQLTADQTALVAYLEALSRLGSGAAFTYGKALGTDITAVNGLGVAPGMNKTVAGDAQKASVAALTLTAKLADLATEHMRGRDVRQIVREADPEVQALTAALYAAGGVDYSILLEDERGLLEEYYGGPLAAAGASDRLTSMLVQRQYDGDVERLERRRTAAAAYGAVMQQMGALHANLAQAARDSTGFDTRLQALAPEVNRLQDAIAWLGTEERIDTGVR